MSEPTTEPEDEANEATEPTPEETDAPEATDEEAAEETVNDEAADEADEEAAEAAEEADEDTPAVKAGLIDAAGAVNVERIAEFGSEAQALVHEVLDRLEDELVAVLADYEARHTDPAAAATLPAARAIRAHMDDARRHLSALAVACQDLATAVAG